MLKTCRDILSVKELCKVLGIGKNMAYRLLQSGALKSVRIGKVYKIPKDFVIDYLNTTLNK